jgi:hypothetical protein
MDIERNARDPRPESYRLLDQDTIKLLDIVGTEKGTWQTRRSLVIKNVYTDMQKLIDAAKDKNKATSLAVFKPKKILDFRIEETDRTWDEAKLAAFRQMELFSANASEAVNKLPYKFSYVFEDENGRQSTLMIEDWEIGQLYWNCLKRRNNNEQKALVDVKKKYLEQFVYASYDIYFFLGTTRGYHFRGKNPFVIVGIFYPKNRH